MDSDTSEFQKGIRNPSKYILFRWVLNKSRIEIDPLHSVKGRGHRDRSTARSAHTLPLLLLWTMISNFFVLSPRGDTIIAKQYRNDRGDAGAHERSHTEAFFRKIKFWDDAHQTPGGGTNGAADEAEAESKATGDAPPVFIMPDGLSYMHVKRNGLIFGCASARNVSAVTVIEVSVGGGVANSAQQFTYCNLLTKNAISVFLI
jgi:hypothetical protein